MFIIAIIYFGLRDLKFLFLLFGVLALCILAIQIYFLSYFPKKITTTENGFYLEGWFGKKENITWNQIVSLCLYPPIPHNKLRYIQYRFIRIKDSKHWGKFFIVQGVIKNYLNLIEEIYEKSGLKR
jgi:hypothetical protein